MQSSVVPKVSAQGKPFVGDVLVLYDSFLGGCNGVFLERRFVLWGECMAGRSTGRGSRLKDSFNIFLERQKSQEGISIRTPLAGSTI
jgi:hypothetical protein